MSYNFCSKNALVTGACKGKNLPESFLRAFKIVIILGIGKAIVKKLIECGAKVIALSNSNDLHKLKTEVFILL